MTESKRKELTAKDFHVLLKDHRPVWMKMAEDASDFARDHICGGQEPKPDDAWKALLIMLEPNELLLAHQKDNGARYRKYRESFGDYVIDEYMIEKNKKVKNPQPEENGK